MDVGRMKSEEDLDVETVFGILQAKVRWLGPIRDTVLNEW